MAILRSKDISKMSENEVNVKLEELKTELIKSRVATKKIGKLNPREIKRTIAKLLTRMTVINKANKSSKKEAKK